MSDRSRVEALVQEKLAGRRVDPVAFIDELLVIAGEAGEVRFSLADEGALRITVGGNTCEIGLDAARSKLRMLCARLSVLCNQSKEAEASPYGGQGVIKRAAARDCAVSWKNTPAEQEFTLSLAP